MGFSGWEWVIIAPPKRDGWLQMADCGQWQALFFINSQFHLNLTETIPLSREWHLVFRFHWAQEGAAVVVLDLSLGTPFPKKFGMCNGYIKPKKSK
jgi:hypothetical protein